MSLKVFDLHHDLFSVCSLLVSQNLEFVLKVLLHEDVVLVENFDRLVDLKDFACLHVFEINLPLLGLLRQAVDLALKVTDLVFDELLEGAHDFLDSGHFLRQGFVRLAGMLYRLLLNRIGFTDHILEGSLEELLPLSDSLRYLTHSLSRLLDVLLGALCDHSVLHLLLITHFLHQSGNLLHGRLDLLHDSLLTVEGGLLAPLHDLTELIKLLVAPITHIFFTLGPE